MIGVVLAAGRATRMRAPKHLLPVAGEPMLARVLRTLGRTQVAERCVVLRPDDDKGRALARALGVPAVASEDPAEGRAASVRAGVRASSGEVAGWLFAMADQPFLEPRDFDALIDAFRTGLAGIVCARYDAQRGTPVLFAARYRDELLALRGHEGGRVLIERHAADVAGVALDPGRGRDLDRPADLATLPAAVERTLSIIKPDAVARNLTGAALQQIEAAGLKIVGTRMLQMERAQAERFYAVHRERPFFESLVAFMSSGPVVVSVLEGVDAIARYRELMGATDPAQAAEGTLRRLYASDIERNAVHGSDSPETAKDEVAFFFQESDLVRRD